MNELHAAPTAAQHIRIDTGAGAISASVSGQGRPLVLLHSLLADRTSFERVEATLAQTHQVIAFDLPGFGTSDAVDGDLSAIADRVAAGIEALRLPERPIVLGNGYGGFVTLAMAIRHPDAVARLVLADCGAAFSPEGRAAFVGMATAAGKNGLSAVADVAMRRLFAPHYQADHPELIAKRRERFLATSLPVFEQACKALSTLDLRDKLAEVRVPVLVLVGEEDEATPPAMSKELASGLPNARLRILPGCAHVPQLQAPEMFLREIDAFIQQVD